VVEPSVAALFQDEYERLLEQDPYERLRGGTVEVGEYLRRLQQRGELEVDLEGRRFFLHGHCQQRAAEQFSASVELLEAAGADVAVSGVECCGMAGSFGYKRQYYELSMKVGQPLFESMEEDSDREALACGSSCTTQIEDGTGRSVRHPVEVIRAAVCGGAPDG